MGKGEFNRAGGRDRGFDLFHTIDLLEFALGLGGFAGLGAKAIGELLQGGDFLLLIFKGGEVLLLAGGFFHNVLIVVAAISVEFGLGNFHDRPDKLVEEFAIVGDHEDGARIVTEIFLKPNERFEIEMVCGFVQKKEIGLLDEKAGKVGSHDPASAEGFGFAVEIGVAEGEATEDLFGARLELPAP